MEEYSIDSLKSEIKKLNKNGEDLKLIGVISLNNDDEKYNPYILICRMDNSIFTINVAVDLVMFNQINAPEEFFKDINEYNTYKFYIEKDEKQVGINKITPIVALERDGEIFNERYSIWTDDFLINSDVEANNLFTVHLSDDYEDVSFKKFINKVATHINEVFDEKTNDFKRLKSLGYSAPQINQIIKSKSVYDIEPMVSPYFDVAQLKEINNAFINLMYDEHADALKLCLMTNKNYDFLVDRKYSEDVRNFLIRDNKYILFPTEKITSQHKLENVKHIYDMVKNKNSINEINLILDPLYNDRQIHAIRQCLKYIDCKDLNWITPEYSDKEIIDIANKFLKGHDIKYYLKENKQEKSLDKLIVSLSNKVKDFTLNAEEEIR